MDVVSKLDWFVTRSNLPPMLKEVLYDLVASIDIEIEAELDEVSGGFKDRIDAIEVSLDDGTGGDSLIDVAELKLDVDDLTTRILKLEEPEDPDDSSLLEVMTEEAIDLEVNLVKEVKLVRREMCPFCGGKFETGK